MRHSKILLHTGSSETGMYLRLYCLDIVFTVNGDDIDSFP